MNIMDGFHSPCFSRLLTLMPTFTGQDSGCFAISYRSGLLETEQGYTVEHVPCKAVFLPGYLITFEEWRRKICRWSFRLSITSVSRSRDSRSRYEHLWSLPRCPVQQLRGKVASPALTCPSTKQKREQQPLPAHRRVTLLPCCQNCSAGSEEESLTDAGVSGSVVCRTLSRAVRFPKSLCAISRTILSP
jgi:hypothetical protein